MSEYKSNGGRPPTACFDEAGDVRLMSDSERRSIKKMWDELKISDEDLINIKSTPRSFWYCSEKNYEFYKKSLENNEKER